MEDDILRPKTVVFIGDDDKCDGDDSSFEKYVNNAGSPKPRQRFHWSSYAGFDNDNDSEINVSPIPNWRCCDPGSDEDCEDDVHKNLKAGTSPRNLKEGDGITKDKPDDNQHKNVSQRKKPNILRVDTNKNLLNLSSCKRY